MSARHSDLNSALTVGVVALIAFGLCGVPALGQSLVSTACVYQGQLKLNGQSVNDSCDFEFELWDAETNGSLIGTDGVASVSVSEGLFAVPADFGQGAINGRACWLEISVRCPAGTGAYSTLSPRQELSAAPHALALPGLRTVWNDPSPPGIASVIGGDLTNYVTAGVVGAAIGGGGPPNVGATPLPNRVTDDFGTVAGGGGNQAGDAAGSAGDARYGAVGGGRDNTASGFYATVAGGTDNRARGLGAAVAGGASNAASSGFATVAGGAANLALEAYAAIGGGGANEVHAEFGTIAGGGWSDLDPATGNRVYDEYCTIGGGGKNRAGSNDGDTSNATYATISGGEDNDATEEWSTISGGRLHTASGRLSTIGGGDENTASGGKSTVGGGAFNVAALDGATVGGGLGNNAGNFNATVAGGGTNNATGDGAAIGGGAGNTAGGFRSTVPGGLSNTADGDYAFATGRRAKAMHQGTFVWADSSDADFASTAQDQLLIRASGGVGIGTAAPDHELSVSLPGGGYARFGAQSNSRTLLGWDAGNGVIKGVGDGDNSRGLTFYTGSENANAPRMAITQNGAVGIGTASPQAALHVAGSDGLAVEGDIQVTETVVSSAMPISSEQSTASTSYVQLVVFDFTNGGADRLFNVKLRLHARGQSSGQTAVFRVRGFGYGTGSSADMNDHNGSAPLLSVVHVRSSVYQDYYLNLGPYAVSSNQRRRFIVEYRTRNGLYPSYIDELEWEARSSRYAY